MKVVCVYHSIDLDGWMSAAIVKHWFYETYLKDYPNAHNSPYHEDNLKIKMPTETIDFIGYNYGQPIPDLSEYDKVIMCDISFPTNVMYDLCEKRDDDFEFIYIDHHISAINDLEKSIKNSGTYTDYPAGTRDVKFAACELTWQYFFPYMMSDTNSPWAGMPELVRLLGRYDCFGHKQIWKSVIGYEGLYEVSNQGNVRSLHKETKELSIDNSKRGYRVVSLFKDGNATMKNVHQLVAQAFIPNPLFKPTVNHKDSNRLNNYVTNLEWNTYEENNLHSIKNGNQGKSVIQFNDADVVLAEYTSLIEAEKETGIQAQNIGKVCKGERNNAGGFRWEYGIDKEMTPQFTPKTEEQKVLEFQYGARQVISNYDEAYTHLIASLDPANGIIEDLLYKGAVIYNYLCTEAKQAYKNGFEVWFDDGVQTSAGNSYKFICINKERFNPINFGIDYHSEGYDGCACFHRTSDGKWAFSFYNDNGLVDCSVIAKQFGGGGHKGAAGCVITDLSLIVK